MRLQDGTRGYIQAIIDNYSRYTLAWKVTSEYGGMHTKELIEQALNKAFELRMELTPNIFVDNGSENINQHVDDLITENKITRTTAGIEIDFSNSMIESLFHRIKNRHLYFVALKNLETLQPEIIINSVINTGSKLNDPSVLHELYVEKRQSIAQLAVYINLGFPIEKLL